MKLRTTFILLSTGIFILPFLVIIISVLFQNIVLQQSPAYRQYRLFTTQIRTQIPRMAETGDFSSLRPILPDSFQLLIVDVDGIVRFSNSPRLAQGERVQFESLSRFAEGLGRGRSFQFTYLPKNEGEGYLVLYRLDRPEVPIITRVLDRRRFLVLLIALSVLLFTALFSVLILRKFNTSLVTLEKATSRVAAGDLDFSLPAVGNDEIASLTRSFDAMRMSLKQEYERRNRFIMGVSHDLKTPLALVRGYTEALQDGLAGNPATQEKYLSIIADKTRLLEGRIGELIDFIKLETGEWKKRFEEIRLNALLDELLSRYTHDAQLYGKRLVYSLSISEDCTVRCDKHLFIRVLENLLINAINYSYGNGDILFCAKQEGRCIILDLSNPVPASWLADPELLFEPFYRLSPSRNNAGSGLGLSTVRSIVNAHGWHITAFMEENTQCENHGKMAGYERTQNGDDSAEAVREAEHNLTFRITII